mgnify:CR=1 FL=1|jgi:hypothetical protein|tara:strand:- start:631 stop:1104 length:474 start_codon:yes stop_codon:yes gene_type:complete
MGRPTNSFNNWVGGASELDSDKVTLPEKDLWVAVLTRAALDACKGAPRLNLTLRSNVTHQNNYTYDRDQARHFFLEGGPHFNLICELAGRNPIYVQQRVRKILLRKNGWNVDVPITSHYRKGPKRTRGRPRKKKLTGNSYYAFIGKKGGRPRMYNGV